MVKKLDNIHKSNSKHKTIKDENIHKAQLIYEQTQIGFKDSISSFWHLRSSCRYLLILLSSIELLTINLLILQKLNVVIRIDLMIVLFFYIGISIYLKYKSYYPKKAPVLGDLYENLHKDRLYKQNLENFYLSLAISNSIGMKKQWLINRMLSTTYSQSLIATFVIGILGVTCFLVGFIWF